MNYTINSADMDKSTCCYCGKELSRMAIKKRFGEFSSVYVLGYCSAQCDLNAEGEALETGFTGK